MPIQDWTRVEAGIFHHFHAEWVAEIPRGLNDGVLPPDYYALAEQHSGKSIADVLTLHALTTPPVAMRNPGEGGGIAVAIAPPKVRLHQTIERAGPNSPRTVAIRHVSGHRLIALLEI